MVREQFLEIQECFTNSSSFSDLSLIKMQFMTEDVGYLFNNDIGDYLDTTCKSLRRKII